MKTRSINSKRIFLSVVIVLLTGILNPALAQIPAAMEQDMDNLNSMFYEALKVIDTKDESEALKELAVLRPKIEAEAKAFADKWEAQELSDEDEMAFGRKLLEKQLYKDLYALIGKPALKSKIKNSPALKKEYRALMKLMDSD